MGWCPGISGPRPRDWWMGTSPVPTLSTFMDTCKESIFLYSDACWLFAVSVLGLLFLCFHVVFCYFVVLYTGTM